MENVYEIKKRRNLNYILPKKSKINNTVIKKSEVVVLIHIYYIEKIQEHIKYIKNIPESIDIIFTISDNETEKKLRKQLTNIEHKYYIIYKKNRGRDISALLVAAKNELLKYQYIGFIHDKKEKDELLKEDINEWNYCLWENMFGSKLYIYNVISILKRNKKIGILVPPIPYTKHLNYGYVNTWGLNFENTKKLANDLLLKSDLDDSKPPITLGTVFWAKRSSIEKLLCYQWNYMDFKQEPMEDDGTISHAVERIFPFVAQDAGFYTGWVMTDEFAQRQMEKQYHIIMNTYDLLKRFYGISLISQVDECLEYINGLSHFCKQFKEIFIYGTGNNGKSCFEKLNKLGFIPTGFLISSEEYTSEKYLFGVSIQTLKKFILYSDMQRIGIIIAVQKKYQKEILECILKAGVNKESIYIYKTFSIL